MGFLIFQGMVSFQDYTFPHFPFVWDRLTSIPIRSWKKWKFQTFISTDLNLRVSNNPSLEVITLPELYDLGGHNIIEGNGQLQSGLRWDEIWSFHDDPKLWFAWVFLLWIVSPSPLSSWKTIPNLWTWPFPKGARSGSRASTTTQNFSSLKFRFCCINIYYYWTSQKARWLIFEGHKETKIGKNERKVFFFSSFTFLSPISCFSRSHERPIFEFLSSIAGIPASRAAIPGSFGALRNNDFSNCLNKAVINVGTALSPTTFTTPAIFTTALPTGTTTTTATTTDDSWPSNSNPNNFNRQPSRWHRCQVHQVAGIVIGVLIAFILVEGALSWKRRKPNHTWISNGKRGRSLNFFKFNNAQHTIKRRKQEQKIKIIWN